METNKPKLQLTGEDGNVYAILGRARRIALQNGMDWHKIQSEVEKLHSYDEVLNLMMEYFDAS